MNSKNVLVNCKGMCVLSDFGFAMQVFGGVKSTDDTTFITEVRAVTIHLKKLSILMLCVPCLCLHPAAQLL